MYNFKVIPFYFSPIFVFLCVFCLIFNSKSTQIHDLIIKCIYLKIPEICYYNNGIDIYMYN